MNPKPYTLNFKHYEISAHLRLKLGLDILGLIGDLLLMIVWG